MGLPLARCVVQVPPLLRELILHVVLTGPLYRLATTSGAAKRTIERLFREEAGLTFGRWQLKKVTQTGQD